MELQVGEWVEDTQKGEDHRHRNGRIQEIRANRILLEDYDRKEVWWVNRKFLQSMER